MKWSAVAALVAAPLVLAGQRDLGFIERRNSMVVDLKQKSDSKLDISSSNSIKGSSDSKSYNGNNNNNNKDSSSSTTIIEQEIIIIWVNNGGGATTSQVNSATSTSSVSIATHSVTVGGSAGLVYTPDTIEAAIGDMVVFTFESQNHTATQSAFTVPCVAIEGGQDSGFMPNPNNTVNPPPQMAMQVKVSTPIWFYCRQKGHCGKGMTFSINPTANKTQAMFQQMAIAQNGTGVASPITGGSSSVVPPASTSTSAVAVGTSTSAAAAAVQTVASGTGSGSGSSCSCSCFCGVASFPSTDQGVSAFGGLSGSMPMALLMT